MFVLLTQKYSRYIWASGFNFWAFDKICHTLIPPHLKLLQSRLALDDQNSFAKLSTKLCKFQKNRYMGKWEAI